MENCIAELMELSRNNQISILLKHNTELKIDFDHYRRMCVQQIENHRRKSNDETFVERYINGVELNEVPPMLECEVIWKYFIESFFETMLYGIRSRTNLNPLGRFAIYVKESLGLNGDEDWEFVYDNIVERWNNDNIFRQSLISYYCEED